jgi:hypothetical protein
MKELTNEEGERMQSGRNRESLWNNCRHNTFLTVSSYKATCYTSTDAVLHKHIISLSNTAHCGQSRTLPVPVHFLQSTSRGKTSLTDRHTEKLGHYNFEIVCRCQVWSFHQLERPSYKTNGYIFIAYKERTFQTYFVSKGKSQTDTRTYL